MFPNDHSTAWVRADLIVKFHPDISSYVQVSAMSCEYASEQNIALDDAIKYYHDKLMNQAPASVLPPNPFPARNSPQSDAYKRGVVRLLGQWMLLTFNEFESPSLIVSGRFKYLDMVADGRKLPPVLRDNLAPFRYWPKKTVVPVHPDGIVSKILPRLATQSQRKAIGKKKKKKKSSSMNTSLSVSTRRRVSPRRRAKTLVSRTLNR